MRVTERYQFVGLGRNDHPTRQARANLTVSPLARIVLRSEFCNTDRIDQQQQKKILIEALQAQKVRGLG